MPFCPKPTSQNVQKVLAIYRRNSQMHLPPPGLAVEDEVLGGLHEPEAQHLLFRVPLGHDDLREVEVLDGLRRGKDRAAHEAAPLVGLAHPPSQSRADRTRRASGPESSSRRSGRRNWRRSISSWHLSRSDRTSWLGGPRVSPPLAYTTS